jgi:hypothetical protein
MEENKELETREEQISQEQVEPTKNFNSLVSGVSQKHIVIKSNRVLDYIRANSPTTKYIISKELNMPYTSVLEICKKLEFASLILSRTIINERRLACLELYIPEVKKDE